MYLYSVYNCDTWRCCKLNEWQLSHCIYTFATFAFAQAWKCTYSLFFFFFFFKLTVSTLIKGNLKSVFILSKPKLQCTFCSVRRMVHRMDNNKYLMKKQFKTPLTLRLSFELNPNNKKCCLLINPEWFLGLTNYCSISSVGFVV